MRKDRLLKLADFLEDIPKKHFYMGMVVENVGEVVYKDRFGKDINDPWRFFNVVVKTKQEQPCSTVACAIGWLPNCFPEEVSRNEDGFPIYMGESYYVRIAINFFHISLGGACYLFSPDYYKSKNPSPKYVAERIRNFCETN